MKAAILQLKPVYFDCAASLHKLEHHLRQAAAQGIQLATVGETWFTGYPAFLDYLPGVGIWDDPAMKQVFARMHAGAITVPGPETAHLAQLCAELKLGLVLGANERVETGPGSGTLYNALLTFNERGQLVNHHRKLMPTFTEKLTYGHGDGAGLTSHPIHNTQVGSLVCWEHWMPLTRQAMHLAGEHVHIAVWPNVHEMHQVASRQYAFEGRCFVLAAGQLLQVKDFPPELTLPPELQQDPDRYVLWGGSCIIGPDGTYLTEPLKEQEGIVSAELDIERCIQERMTLDVTGHYNRPDVFQFTVNKNRPA